MILTPKHLLEKICKIFEIEESKISGSCRKKNLILIRFLFCYVGVRDLCFSRTAIGEILKGKSGKGDHAKVINAINRIEQRIDKDDMIVVTAILKIRTELGIYRNDFTSTILEKQYDALYLELLEVKKENKELKQINAINEAKLNKLLLKCLSHS